MLFTRQNNWKCFLFLYTAIFSMLYHPSVDAVSLKILGIFPHPGKSHFYFFHPILRELAVRGHDVTVISPFPDKNPPKGYHDLQIPGVVVQNSVDLNVSNYNLYVNNI